MRYTPDELAALLDHHPPTSQQRGVIVAPLEPLLVVAGAGSGKTATMADRVVWLVANDLARPEEILGVTFTRKAAGELSERLRGHLGTLRSALRRGEETRSSGQADAGQEVEAAEAEEEDLGLLPVVSTYHSFAHSMVAEHGMRLGLEPDAPLWGEAKCWQLATRVVDAYDGPHEDVGVARSTLVNAVLSYASQAAEHLVDPEDTVDWLLERADRLEELPIGATARATKPSALIARLRTRAVVARLAADYRRAKARRGVLDYGDLVVHASALAGLSEVAASLRARHKVVLLDEFQDTSHAQLTLFARLFGAAASLDGVAHAVTAVGDPNQSIYGFRGASARQLAAFRTAFPVWRDGVALEAPQLDLSIAWRNDVAILTMANAIAAPLAPAGEEEQESVAVGAGQASAEDVGFDAGATDEPPRVVGQGEDPTGIDARDAVRAWESAVVEHPAAITPARRERLRVPRLSARPHAGGGGVVLCRFVTAAEEAIGLADFIVRERLAARTEGAWPSTAVLCRKRSAMEPIAQALRERGVPVEVVGLGGLLSTPEVQDIVATLRTLSDPGRSDALMRLLAGARWRIGPADLMVLGDHPEFRARRRAYAARRLAPADFETPDGSSQADSGHADGPEVIERPSLIEALEHLPRPGWTSKQGRVLGELARARLALLRDELRELRLVMDEELPLLVAQIVRRLGVDVEVLAKPGLDEHAARRHLDAFSDVVADFAQGQESADVHTLLDWLDAAAERESGLPAAPEPAADGTVQILTVHAAKGLEWDIVAVPGLQRGSFPSATVSRWTSGSEELPWPWRGDRDGLPQFTALEDPGFFAEHQGEFTKLEGDKDDGFVGAAASHAEREERRLAYVAVTRARHLLWASASLFTGTNKTPAELSPFFEDMAAHLPGGGAGTEIASRGPWLPEELPDGNPESGVMLSAPWPYDPLEGPTVLKDGEPVPRLAVGRRAAAEAAADQLLAAVGVVARGGLDALPQPATAAGKAWDLEARILLSEREAERRRGMDVPGHVRASLLVEASEDPEGVGAQLRRPIPHRPGLQARRGTLFHSWVQDHFESAEMFDLDDASFFEDVEAVDAPILSGLQEKFLASEWARRTPAAVEVPFETQLGGISVRGRIDAVYRDDDGRWDVVDWKTGRVPSPRALRHKAIQLAVYRLALARIHGLDPAQVSAAFYYVQDGKTVRPELPWDEESLARLLTGVFDQDA